MPPKKKAKKTEQKKSEQEKTEQKQKQTEQTKTEQKTEQKNAGQQKADQANTKQKRTSESSGSSSSSSDSGSHSSEHTVTDPESSEAEVLPTKTRKRSPQRTERKRPVRNNGGEKKHAPEETEETTFSVSDIVWYQLKDFKTKAQVGNAVNKEYWISYRTQHAPNPIYDWVTGSKLTLCEDKEAETGPKASTSSKQSNTALEVGTLASRMKPPSKAGVFTPVYTLTQEKVRWPLAERDSLLFLCDKDAIRDFMCSVCYLVALDPIQTKCCKAAFCRACISPQPEKNTGCPCCLGSQLELESNQEASQKLALLTVRCRLDKNCTATGILGSDFWAKHGQDCKFAYVCKFCRGECEAGQTAAHEKTCGEAFTVCSPCGAIMQQKTTSSHVCPPALVQCPACKKDIAKDDMSGHAKVSCPAGRAVCEYAKYGCTYEGTRDAMKLHEVESKDAHLLALKHCLDTGIKPKPPDNPVLNPSQSAADAGVLTVGWQCVLDLTKPNDVLHSPTLKMAYGREWGITIRKRDDWYGVFVDMRSGPPIKYKAVIIRVIDKVTGADSIKISLSSSTYTLREAGSLGRGNPMAFSRAALECQELVSRDGTKAQLVILCTVHVHPEFVIV